MTYRRGPICGERHCQRRSISLGGPQSNRRADMQPSLPAPLRNTFTSSTGGTVGLRGVCFVVVGGDDHHGGGGDDEGWLFEFLFFSF